MRKIIIAIFIVVLMTNVVFATTPARYKTWATREILTSSDMNLMQDLFVAWVTDGLYDFTVKSIGAATGAFTTSLATVDLLVTDDLLVGDDLHVTGEINVVGAAGFSGDFEVANTANFSTTGSTGGYTRLAQSIETNTASSYGGISLNCWSATDGHNSSLMINKSGSNTVGNYTSVVDDESLGGIYFRGSDGSDLNYAASIQAFVDGTPSDGTDMPGRLHFLTSHDGSDTSITSIIINSSQNTTLGATDLAGANVKLAVDGATMHKVFGANDSALIPTPTAGYSTQFVRTLGDGKDHVIMKFDDGATAEIAVQP